MMETLLYYAVYYVYGALSLSFLLVFYRLVSGPTLADRVVALDLIALIGVAFIATYAILANEPVYFRVAIILALVVLLGTIAFAYFLEKRGRP